MIDDIDTKTLLKGVRKLRKAEQTKRYKAAQKYLQKQGLETMSKFPFIVYALKIAAGLLKT